MLINHTIYIKIETDYIFLKQSTPKKCVEVGGYEY